LGLSGGWFGLLGRGRGFFERRGREGCAESAEEDRKEFKMKTKTKKEFLMLSNNTKNLSIFFGIYFVFSFLRSLRNLCDLCVQKMYFPCIKKWFTL
jgi:hypothetical protein